MASVDNTNTLTRRCHWMGLHQSRSVSKPKLTREASTSMEDLTSSSYLLHTPGRILRPKSMCVPNDINALENSENGKFLTALTREDFSFNYIRTSPTQRRNEDLLLSPSHTKCAQETNSNYLYVPAETNQYKQLRRTSNLEQFSNINKRTKFRRNPVQRAASRLYRAGDAPVGAPSLNPHTKFCVGPEFVVRATLPSKQLSMNDCKGSVRKIVTVIMLDGQKLDITCNPNTTTAGQIFEVNLFVTIIYFLRTFFSQIIRYSSIHLIIIFYKILGLKKFN